MAGLPDDLTEQVRRNASTRESFGDFATHRSRVMQLLLLAAAEFGDQPTLILLGAGNCNDVDLPPLLQIFRQLHLVDCDAEALRAGIQRQLPAVNPRITLHAPVDLSENSWTPPPSQGPMVVASLCLLSQLIEAATQPNRSDPATIASRVEAVRSQHLQHIVELLPPGGIGLLITDFTSSLTAPALTTATDADLPRIVAELLSAGNFFQGLHPGALFRLLTTDPPLANRISCQNPTAPWNWKVGNRVYAVSALVMRRKLAVTGMIEP